MRGRLRPCIEPACGKLTTRTRCPEHAAARDAGRRDFEPWRRIYSDARWLKAAARCLARDGGRCRGSWGGRRCDATEDLQAHHTTPLRVLYSRGQMFLAFDVAMLVTLCPRCHAAAERRASAHGE